MDSAPQPPLAASNAPFSAPDLLRQSDPVLSTCERALLLVRRVPLLLQAVRSAACSQDALVDALVAREYVAGEYIYAQGETGARELFFLERGRVLLTKRRHATAASGVSPRLPAAGRCRSQAEMDMETQVDELEPSEYFGELSLLSNAAARTTSAVAVADRAVDPAGEASGDGEPPVACFVMSEIAFATLLAPLHELMLARAELRLHRVLDRERLFQAWSWPQKRFVLERCAFARFQPGARLCEQSDTHDDRFFIVVEGEADVVVADEGEDECEPKGVEGDDDQSQGEAERHTPGTVVARKCRFQSFGEMALLGFPRVASVVATGPSQSTSDGGGLACIVITRAVYAAAKRAGTRAVSLSDGRETDSEAGSCNDRSSEEEAALASALADEWALAANARKLRLSNPRVARHLVTFIQHFKAAYQQLFEGKSAYLDLLRRLRDEPELVHGSAGGSTGELSALVERIVGPDTSLPVPLTVASLGVVRAETRRVLSLLPSARTAQDVALIARLVEKSALVSKIERPAHVSPLQVARSLAQVVTFVRASKDRPLVRQGRVESRAFLILRGRVNIVNERGAGGVDVLATLRAGDSFGELSLVTKQRRSASAFAPSSADLVAFDREHLAHIQREIPGVSVQHVMVKRAEFLVRLSFMRPAPSASAFEMERAQDEAFGECIRVAHDVVERSYGPRHRFFQEEGDRRALLIVRAGEVGVFMRKHLPVLSTPGGAAAAVPSSPSHSVAASRVVLVRVATIGPQEIFGATLTALSTPPNAAVDEAAAQLEEATMYVSGSHVDVLELPERGWRRLRPASVEQIRRALIKRLRWNARAAVGQRYFYHADRPWQLVGTSTSSSSSEDGGACSGETRTAVTVVPSRVPPQCPEAIEPATTTPLARHVNDKRRQTGRAGAFVDVFANAGDARGTLPAASGKMASSVRCASPIPSLLLLPALPASGPPQASVTPATTAAVHNAPLSLSMAAWEKDCSSRTPSASSMTSSSTLGGSFSPNSSTLAGKWVRSLAGSRATGDVLTTPNPPVRVFASVAPPPGSAATQSSPRVAQGRRRPVKQQQLTVKTRDEAGDKFHSMWKLDRRTSLG